LAAIPPCRIVAPVDTDVMIDSLHERIARVLHSQAIEAVRNFLAGGSTLEGAYED
jgi:hypothetical protein